MGVKGRIEKGREKEEGERGEEAWRVERREGEGMRKAPALAALSSIPG